MKLFYEDPELEIVLFDVEDIITTSAEVTTVATGDDDEMDEITDTTVSGDPDDDAIPETTGSGSGAAGSDSADGSVDADDVPAPSAPAVTDPVPSDPVVDAPEDTTSAPDDVPATTAAHMTNGGTAGWGDGDHIDFSDLLG